jgi:ferric-dicitrate binding protein FerR (iron transport regulator)
MEKEELYRYFAGKATDAEKEEIGRWLTEDKDAFSEYRRAQFIFEGAAVYGGEKQAVKKSGRKTFRRFVAIASAAAVAALFFVAGGLIMKHESMDEISSKTLSITTKPGERASITLPDGTFINLNSGTTLTYPAVFTGKERTVYLEGEALFDVKHDEDHPFIVSTFASKVKVLGTEFCVTAEKPEGIFSVYLKEGKVSVGLNGSSENIIMKPEDIVSLVDGRLTKAVQDDKSALCWLDGLVNIKCDSFSHLMDRLSNAYGIEIEINGECPSIDGLSGEIRISEGIEHALRSLQHVVSFSYEHDEGSDKIIINP